MMANKKREPKQNVKTVEISFTKESVMDSEVSTAVPKGYRIAQPQEIALAWKTDSSFRIKLSSLRDGAWTSQMRLDSQDFQRIDDFGRFTKIKRKEFEVLEAKDRSWHHGGAGRVVVSGKGMLENYQPQLEDYRGPLLVLSSHGGNFYAPVAIVKEKEDVKTARN